MFLRTWRFLTLLLAALGLTLGAAHALELPPKMRYDGEMYAAVNSTLYRLFGALCLALSLVLWLALVQPVNAAWAEVFRSAPASAPEAFLRLRARWEYGHVAAFAAWLAGFGLLLLSVLAETPAGRPGMTTTT